MVKLKHNNLPKATQLVSGRAGFKSSQFGDISWTCVLHCPNYKLFFSPSIGHTHSIVPLLGWMSEWIDDPERSGGLLIELYYQQKNTGIRQKGVWSHPASSVSPLCFMNFIIWGGELMTNACILNKEDSWERFRAEARIRKCLWKLQDHQLW